MSTRIRPATVDDADGLAAVHVRSWQGAYRGLLADDFLDAITVAPRVRQWRELLDTPAGGRAWVAECAGGGLTGFVHTGPSRDDDTDREVCAEVTSIYVLPERWGTGTGSALMRAALEGLSAAGFHEAILWVLRDNRRAVDFYEAGGWTSDGHEKQDRIGGTLVTEVRYRRRPLAL